jgi:hypothetical protein
MKKFRKSVLSVLLVAAMIAAVIPMGMLSVGAEGGSLNLKGQLSEGAAKAMTQDINFAERLAGTKKVAAERISTSRVVKTVDITGKTCSQIGSEIQSACNANGTTEVMVTGSKTNGNSSISFKIPDNVTVVWKATYKAQNVDFAVDLFESSTRGFFDLVVGGSIENSASTGNTNQIVALYGGTAYVTIAGGTIKAPAWLGIGVMTEGGVVEMFSGDVKAEFVGMVALTMGLIIVEGGKVEGVDYSIYTESRYGYPCVALYYVGTINGATKSQNAAGQFGAIFSVKSRLVPTVWSGKKTGITLTSGNSSGAKWVTNGTSPIVKVSFSAGDIDVYWGVFTTRLPGDANDDFDVTSTDATLMLRNTFWVGSKKPTINVVNADVDGNDKVTSVDATLVLRYIFWTKNRPELLF